MNPSKPSLPYSRFRHVGNLTLFSGIVPLDASGRVVSDSFAAQFEQVMRGVRAALASAGVGLDEVVQTRCYLADAAYFDEFNSLYRAAFVEPYPVRTTIVAGMAKPGMLLEIEMVAARGTTNGASE